MKLDVSSYPSPEAVLAAIDAKLKTEGANYSPLHPVSEEVAKPVVELLLHGTLGFKRHELDLDAVEDLIRLHCDPLLPRVKYDAIPAEYAVAPGMSLGTDRKELEASVIRDLVARDSRYQAQAEATCRTIIELKLQAIAGTPPAEIASLVAQLLETPA